MALLALAAMTVEATASVRIATVDGWYTSVLPSKIGESDSEEEWRNIQGSWFRCFNGGLQDFPSDSGMSDWDVHSVPASSKVFYTAAWDALGGRDLWILTSLANGTGSTGHLHDIRECRPRSMYHAWIQSDQFSCNTSSLEVNDTDCPVKCFNGGAADLQTPNTVYPCRMNYSDDECVLDRRCVPQESHFSPTELGTGSWKSGGKCLAASENMITSETCDDKVKSQQWTFLTVGEEVSV